MWVRRNHLYLGLSLFPWAILYGVTAFLFNHPTAFSDQLTTAFPATTPAGTPLETLPAPQVIASQVLAKLNETQIPDSAVAMTGSAMFPSRR